MTNCLCRSLCEELNVKMKEFEERFGNSCRNEELSLKGQYKLLQQQQNMAADLREIEITQEVLFLCPNMACKRAKNLQNTEIPEYLIGPMREEMVERWVREEIDCESIGIDGDRIVELMRAIPNRCLSDVESVGSSLPRRTGRWVLVYGFTPSLLPLVVAMFSQMGELLSSIKSPAGTWAAFCYVHLQDANRALRHHETTVSGQPIGVTNQEDFIRNVLACRTSQDGCPTVSRPIRALRKPMIETRSANCRAPAPISGWRKVVYHVMELLNF